MEDFEIFRPQCGSTKEVLHAIAAFQADLSPSGGTNEINKIGDFQYSNYALVGAFYISYNLCKWGEKG
jgi:hypothetical protein